MENVKKTFKCNICGFDGDFVDFRGRTKEQCPECKSLCRHRFLYKIIRPNLDKSEEKKTEFSVLHFSPNEGIKNALKNNKYCEYKSVDTTEGEDEIVDIQRLQFVENSFDVIICIHVLEHVEDDKEAIREMIRVLKPNGVCFIAVPFEGKNYKKQSDHLRGYEIKAFTDKLKKISKGKFNIFQPDMKVNDYNYLYKPGIDNTIFMISK